MQNDDLAFIQGIAEGNNFRAGMDSAGGSRQAEGGEDVKTLPTILWELPEISTAMMAH